MILAALTRLAEPVFKGRALLPGAGRLRARMMLRTLPPRASIWIHAASVGEVNSASVLIEALAARHSVLVTTNSETGMLRARAQGWNAVLAPLDLPAALGRFLDAARPALAITVEAEIWPTRSRLLAARGIPHVIVGARMSARSARRWARAPGVIGPILKNVAALSAQDEASEARLLSLGLNPQALLPRLDLKLLAPARVRAPAPSPQRDRTLLAASTHPGEDEPILDAWLAARAHCPGLRLILAPRHPDRADQLAARMTARGLTFGRRSAGAGDRDGDGDGDEAESLLLADTLGEMPLWYDRAGICITGGSLADHGGHTPWEPAAHGCALLHGPHVANFAESYAALDQAGAARLIDAASLPHELARLLSQPLAAREMGRAARGLLDMQAGDPAQILERIANLVKTV